MDIVGWLESVIASPLTVALATAAGFALGLVARPYFEARSNVYRDTVTERRAMQRETLNEIQSVLEKLPPRAFVANPAVGPAKKDQQEAERRLAILLTRVDDSRVWRSVNLYVKSAQRERVNEMIPAPFPTRDRTPPRLRPTLRPSKARAALRSRYDKAHEEIGAALRRL
jgi:hypothetical protein